MKGRQILIEEFSDGRNAAVLRIDGRIEDVFFDAVPGPSAACPEAIHRAIVGRPMKGIGGVMVDLGEGVRGFLRTRRPPPAGSHCLVQVTTWAEPDKAVPVTERVIFKGQAAIVTPGAPGANLARKLRDPQRRETLTRIARSALGELATDAGLVLRSAAGWMSDDRISAELLDLVSECRDVLAEAHTGPAACLRPGPGAAERALRDWPDRAGQEVVRGCGVFAEHDVWSDLDALRDPAVSIGAGSLAVEGTRALVAIDVDTGGDTSRAAALKANLAAAREIPRQLRLRGLGGQVVTDFAPLAKPDRALVESALKAALADDPVETTIAGWSPLGLLELQRKRERRPVREFLARGEA